MFYKIKMYATCNFLVKKFKSNKELTRVDDWLIPNKLTLNVSKTNCILFRPPKSEEMKVNPVVSSRGKQIERVTSTKFLGVYVDQHLSWKTHMKHLVLLNQIKSTDNFLSRPIHLELFARRGIKDKKLSVKTFTKKPTNYLACNPISD